MAGSLYLGSQRVCPAILMGGGGYTEFPCYKVENGLASRISGNLIGNEFTDITSVGEKGFYYAFYGCSGLVGRLNLSSLTSVGEEGFYYAFYGCSGLTGLDLSSLTTVGVRGFPYAFYGCSGLSGVLDLSKVTTIGERGMQHAFDECTNLTSVDLSSLNSIRKYGFYFAFRGCSGLKSIYFNSLKSNSVDEGTSFRSMLYLVNGCTVHFPSNLEAVIGGWSDVVGGFGGTNTTVLYDLEPTEN